MLYHFVRLTPIFPTKSHDLFWNLEPRVQTQLHNVFKFSTNFLIELFNDQQESTEYTFLLTITHDTSVKSWTFFQGF